MGAPLHHLQVEGGPAANALVTERGDATELVIGQGDDGSRLDLLVAGRTEGLSRSYLQQLIEQGAILVDGRPRKPSYRLRAGEVVALRLPAPEPPRVVPEAIPLRVVFEDDDIVVIDKPPGMVVHPSAGHDRGTVVNAVLAHAPAVRVNGSARPGIVHRLDKETSGLLVVAKHERALEALQRQFKARSTLKVYRALLDGVLEPDEAEIDVPIARDLRHRQRMAARSDGRSARSYFTVVERLPRHTLVDARIETGRTHQIRVHAAFTGHPVTGDRLYGRPSLDLKRQFLHASRLGITLLDGSWHEFQSPLPADLEMVLERLRGA